MSGTKAGEFFVSLGVKGSEKTTGDVDKTTDSFKNLKSVSTEAKLAVLAVLYGVERMVSSYGVLGTQLKNFTTISGISAKTLQEYEIAAQKAGASNQELTQTFDSLQKMMYGVQTGQTNPSWLQVITGTLQGQGVKFTPEETTNTAQAWMNHPELMFQRISAFAQNKLLTAAQTTNVLRELGLSDNIIAGMMRGMFSGKALAGSASEVISDKTINQLTTMNKEWTDMIFKFKQFMATIAGSDLTGFVHDLSGVATQLERIARDLDFLGHKGGFFQDLHSMMEGTQKSLSGINELLTGQKMKGLKDFFGGMFKFEPQKSGIYQTFHITVNAHDQKGGMTIGKIIKEEVIGGFKHIPDLYSAKSAN